MTLFKMNTHRMHSLQRTHALSKSKKFYPHQSSSSNPVQEQVYDEARVDNNNEDEEGSSAVVSIDAISHTHILSNSNHHCDDHSHLVSNNLDMDHSPNPVSCSTSSSSSASASFSNHMDSQINDRSRKSKSMFMVLDNRTNFANPLSSQPNPARPTFQPSQYFSNDNPMKPLTSINQPTNPVSNYIISPTLNASSEQQTLLHMIANNPINLSSRHSSTHNNVSFSSSCKINPFASQLTSTTPMTLSTLSAETPTPTATPTPTPEQNSEIFPSIIDDEMELLKHAPWYQALLPREIAFELLAREEIGSFLVRNSATHPGCCALSVRVPIQDNLNGITHYLIQKTHNGVRLKGLDKEWPSLQALVTHLTVIPEMLPCPLKLPAYTNNPIFTLSDPQLPKKQSMIHGSNRKYSEQTSQTSNTHHRDHHSNFDDQQPPNHRILEHGPRPSQSMHNPFLSCNSIQSACHNAAASSSIGQFISQPLINDSSNNNVFGCQQINEVCANIFHIPFPDNKHPLNLDVGNHIRVSSNLENNSLNSTNSLNNDLCSNSKLTNCILNKNVNNNNNGSSNTQLDQNNNHLEKKDVADIVDDEDYQRLSDFSSIMADLNFIEENVH